MIKYFAEETKRTFPLGELLESTQHASAMLYNSWLTYYTIAVMLIEWLRIILLCAEQLQQLVLLLLIIVN